MKYKVIHFALCLLFDSMPRKKDIKSASFTSNSSTEVVGYPRPWIWQENFKLFCKKTKNFLDSTRSECSNNTMSLQKIRRMAYRVGQNAKQVNKKKHHLNSFKHFLPNFRCLLSVFDPVEPYIDIRTIYIIKTILNVKTQYKNIFIGKYKSTHVYLEP